MPDEEIDYLALRSQVEEEERTLLFPHFTHEDAWRLGTLIVGIAQERGYAIAIDITRGEQQVFHAGMPGSSADNDWWIAGKVRTTKRVGVSTMLVRAKQAVRAGRYAWLEKPNYIVSGGCFPINMAGGALVGTITVSGLLDTEDHALAVEAIRLFLAETPA